MHAKPANSTTNKPVLLMAMMVFDGSTTTAINGRHTDIYIAARGLIYSWHAFGEHDIYIYALVLIAPQI